MTFAKLILCLAWFTPGLLVAQQAQVSELMSKDLKDINREGLMITVVYPPGSSDPAHRHYAHAFVYVLEGSISMQVKGGQEVTLTPGRPSMKARMTSTLSAGTQARPNRQSLWFLW